MTEETLFVAALEKPDPVERAAFLDRACRGDSNLRERIEDRLRRYLPPIFSLHSQTTLETTRGTEEEKTPSCQGQPSDPTAFLPPPEGTGTRIGPYYLRERLGEGGMGAVWMAEQSEPVQRCVALKVIKAGLDSAHVLARFEAERQALALMDHPHIAKVFDAGSTPEGRPYFVMELVRGIPLTRFCDREQLTLPERLRLFVLVCQAVQHAHQKGVIHRDLKPSNVLAANSDGKPSPKIIDFGIAKAISRKLGEHTIATEVGQVVGTPEYMAPEQAEPINLDIDTRADIYSLGVMLYELLSGSPPFPSEQLRRLTFLEMLRTIREVEPPKPSTRLSGATDLANLAQKRRLAPRQLTKLVRSELDWIAMKCLEKDRTRRYPTANDLAKDIERYLAGEPVLAGPPSATYRLRKFVFRHKGPVLAAMLVLLALVGGIAGTSLGLLEAQRHRKAAEDSAGKSRQAETEAQQHRKAAEDSAGKSQQAEAEMRAVLTFFQDKVLAAARPKEQEGGLGVDTSIQAAVDAAEPKIAAAFQNQPHVEAEVRQTLGQTYTYLGQAKKAIRQFERAVELRKTHLGPDHPATLASMNELARAYQDDGRLKDAHTLADETLRRRQAALGPDHPDTLGSMHLLAYVHQQAGRWDDAQTLYRQVLELQKAKLGVDHLATLGTMNDLAVFYKQTGRLKEALPLYEETLKGRKAVLGPDHPLTLSNMNNLAMAYKDAGRLRDAELLLGETWKRMKERLGPNHRETLTIMNNLAEVYHGERRLKEAMPLYEEALKGRKAVLGPNHPLTLVSMSDLVAAYKDAGRFQEAVTLGEETLKRRQAALGADHPDTLTSMNNLAVAYRAAGRLKEAAPLFQETLKRQIAKRGPDHPYVIHTGMSLAGTFRDMGRLDEALPLAESAAAKARRRFGPNNPAILRFLDELANLYERRKEYDKAESVWREIAAFLHKNAGNDPRPYAAVLVKVGLNSLRQQKNAAAETILREALAIRRDKQPNDWETFHTESLLGVALLRQKKYAEAEPLLLQGYRGLKQRARSIPDKDKECPSEALDHLVQLYAAWDKNEKADRWRREKVSATREKNGP